MMERMDGIDLIQRSNTKTFRRAVGVDNGWNKRHVEAMKTVDALSLEGKKNAHEIAFVSMLTGWAAYADAHFHRHEAPIGEDYFLGPLWLEMGKSIRGMLNGDTGRLDCGTLDGLIIEIIEHNGFDTENL